MRTKSHWAIGLVTLTALSVGWALAQNRGPDVPPETLLPASAAIYFSCDGIESHQQAWQQTAAYESLVKSGLADAVQKMIASLGAQAQRDPKAAEAYDLATSAMETLWNHGLSVAVSGSPASPPFGVVVIHDGAELRDGLTKLVAEAARGEAKLTPSMIEGRSVVSVPIPKSPAEVAWWSEGGHLVVAVGLQPVQQAIAVAAGNQPNITTHRLWEKYSGSDVGFEQTSVGWVDFQSLQQSFGGIPLPIPVAEGKQPVQVRQLLQMLGLDSLEEIACQSGFAGRSCRTKTSVVAPGPHHGVLALSDQTPITFADLPPLPVQLTSMGAASFDVAAAVDVVIKTLGELADYGPPQARRELDDGLAKVDKVLGLNVREDLLAPLGNVHCFYSDSGQGMFGIGMALVSKVDDAARLRQSIDHLLERAVVESDGKLSIQRVDKSGRQIAMLQIPETPFAPAICVDDNWLCLGLSPQIVESFLLRLDGSMERWQPSDEVAALLADMPKEFVSVSLSDPRPAYQMLLTWGPMIVGMAQSQMQREGALPEGFPSPFNMADIPPVELVTGPLHMNVRMQTITENGAVTQTKTSLAGIPLLGGGGSPSVATSGILVALLLPAVQQAREAARRTRSKNNLKMIGLAMHNYHDVFSHFPQGTIPNDQLKPDKRLSWQVSILPFVDQARLYNQFDMKAGWQAAANAMLVETAVPAYVNPSVPTSGDRHNVTNYAGCAGVGKDGPTLPVDSKRAGIFAYDRTTTIRNVKDGTSNTIMVYEVDKNLGPWAQGGESTIRPLTAEPYINGPDGIGGQHHGGAEVLLGDGSVRFLNEDIDPDVMKAMATMNGGENISGF